MDGFGFEALFLKGVSQVRTKAPLPAYFILTSLFIYDTEESGEVAFRRLHKLPFIPQMASKALLTDPVQAHLASISAEAIFGGLVGNEYQKEF